ncbi:MAG: adenine deaminase [Spirochaetaceae bacterium]|jgi:adenine deaminase|nr:adenine deaminase [Spirochaetaceae bacterium]
MEKSNLKNLIDAAAGRIPAELVLKGGTIADVYSGVFVEADLAIHNGKIAGIGRYSGKNEVDARGLFLLPGFIDTHIHIESSHLRPQELGRLLVPCGTSTIISDPHEIVNVAGLAALKYMISAAEKTALDIKFSLPSCVPATPFETSGAKIEAKDMLSPLQDANIIGLGEFMDYYGVINAEDSVLEKLIAAKKARVLIDGHSPGVHANALNAYIAPGILNDHECETEDDARERVMRGMFVMLRQGSACHDFERLIGAVNAQNERRFVFCSDDIQPKTIFEEGHINRHLRMAIKAGLPAISAIRMATLNAAECFRLFDRGGIAPGLRADITLVSSITDFKAEKVYIEGKLTAENGKYLPPVEFCDDSAVRSSFHVKDFSQEKLRLFLKKDEVFVIDMSPGSIVTGKTKLKVQRNSNGEFVYNNAADIIKIAVIERHHSTGEAACALLRGYGLKKGAIALSIAHDSHNIICVGANDNDMALAVRELIASGGGIYIAENGAIKAALPLPIAGLISDKDGKWVEARLNEVHSAAKALGVKDGIDPVITLCFMSLPVIPHIKLTCRGLFDTASGGFIPIEAP